MDKASSTHGDKRNEYRIFVGKPEGEVSGRIILKWILER
jgi:hypothetical protein